MLDEDAQLSMFTLASQEPTLTTRREVYHCQRCGGNALTGIQHTVDARWGFATCHPCNRSVICSIIVANSSSTSQK